MPGAGPVLLIAGSIAAFERLTTGEASAFALWLVAVWLAFRLLAWMFSTRRVAAHLARVYAALVERGSE